MQISRSMKYFLYLICFISVIFGMHSCRSIKYVPVENKSDSIVVEKLTEIQIPPDSATIRALLECDEKGKIVLNRLNIATSKNAQAQLTIDSLGNLIAKMKTQSDTVYIRSKDVSVTKKVPVPYPIEKKLTRRQQLYIKIGDWTIKIIVFIIFVVTIWIIHKWKK